MAHGDSTSSLKHSVMCDPRVSRTVEVASADVPDVFVQTCYASVLRRRVLRRPVDSLRAGRELKNTHAFTALSQSRALSAPTSNRTSNRTVS